MFARLVPRPLIVCRRSPTTTCRRAHGCQRRWSALAELLSSVGGGGRMEGHAFMLAWSIKKRMEGGGGGELCPIQWKHSFCMQRWREEGPRFFFSSLLQVLVQCGGGEDPRKTHGCISRCGGPTRPTTQRTHGRPFLGAHEWPACSYEEDPRFNMKAW